MATPCPRVQNCGVIGGADRIRPTDCLLSEQYVTCSDFPLSKLGFVRLSCNCSPGNHNVLRSAATAGAVRAEEREGAHADSARYFDHAPIDIGDATPTIRGVQ
jgi:hypothetical protein